MTKLTRRLMLATAVAALGCTLSDEVDAAMFRTGAVAAGGLPNLTAELTFPGGSPVAGTLIYDIANGTDMGSYVSPTAGFTQRCIRVRHASLANFFIDFRPDVSGGRIEVLPWNGETLGTVTSKYFRNLPAYTLVVKLNGVAQSEAYRGTSSSIPYHYWATRWRWQSALRPIIRTASQVFSGGFLPNMSLTAARYTGYTGVIVPAAPQIPDPTNANGKNGDGTAMTAATAYGYAGYIYQFPMIPDDSSVRLWGISCNGDNGGAGDHEGLVTKVQADWLLNNRASSLNTMMQTAEFFSCQANAIFIPDQVVGGPINQKSDVTHYMVSANAAYGSFYKTANGGYGQALTTGGFAGSISGTTLTVYSPPDAVSGIKIQLGMVLKSMTNGGATYGTAAGVITPGTYIVSQLTGAAGDVGTYQISNSMSVVAGVTITNVSYNSGTGLVTLTLSSNPGIAPATYFGVQVGSGTGSFASLNGLFAAGGGTSGTTLTYTIATGLTLTATGGGVAPYNMNCWGTNGEYQSKGDEHSPQAWYLPWVLTEDPFYIEGQQYHETYALMTNIYHKETDIGNWTNDPTGQTGVNGAFTIPIPGGEERSIGWSVKNIASCYKMSPASSPSWLLSSTYWGTVSSDVSTCIDYYKGLEPTNQLYTVFHSIGYANGSDTPQTFYKAYVAYCFGFADLVSLPVPAASGHSAPTTWFNQLTYMFDFIRQVTDSSLASGWNVQTPIIHDTEPPTWMSNEIPTPSGCTPGTTTTRPTGNNCVATFAQLWTYAGSYSVGPSPPYPSNPSPGFIGGNPGNLGPLVAGIAVAKSRGVTGAAACFTFINSMIDYSFPQTSYGIPFQQQDGFDGT
jgi:hypothetical protein